MPLDLPSSFPSQELENNKNENAPADGGNENLCDNINQNPIMFNFDINPKEVDRTLIFSETPNIIETLYKNKFLTIPKKLSRPFSTSRQFIRRNPIKLHGYPLSEIVTSKLEPSISLSSS